jgi:hypothetical protein
MAFYAFLALFRSQSEFHANAVASLINMAARWNAPRRTMICDMTFAITGCENYRHFRKMKPKAGTSHHLPLLAWYGIYKKK